MAAPALSTSSPLDGAVDVFVNLPLTATFTAALDADSVTENSVILLDVGSGQIVDVEVDYLPSTNTVRVTPIGSLADNTVYKLRFPGTDISINNNFVIKDAGSGDLLANTIDITFTTGSKVFIDDTSVDKDYEDYVNEGDLRLPANVKVLGYLAVESTTPKNHAADVPTTIDGSNRVAIQFNKPLSGALVSSDWVSVDVYPVLDNDQYIASGTVLGSGTIPTVSSVSGSSETLYVQFSDELPKNVGVEVTLSEQITADDGAQLGENNFKLSFTTDRFPKVAGIHVVKKELNAIAEVLNDDYIAALLLSATVQALYRFGLTTDEITSDYRYYKWVLLKTLLEILDDQELEKAIVAGTRRQLGSLNVSVDAIIGQAALKRQRVKDDLDNTDDGIRKNAALIKVYTETFIMSEYPDRLWHGVAGKLLDARWKTYQPDIPAANLAINRQAKTPPTYWWY